MTNLFQGLFDSAAQTVISVPDFMLCVLVALVIGAFLALVYTYKNTYTKSFVATLATLPAVVCVVIMMVNGNVGAGVATAGAFSLVRFRSAPGSAREISTLFIAMASGLIAGMGYLAYAVLFALIMGLISLLYQSVSLKTRPSSERALRITMPEDLDYTDMFDDILDRYTSSRELTQVKTSNMGSLFKLNYRITLRNPAEEKKLIDELRVRNGNLEIRISRQEAERDEL